MDLYGYMYSLRREWSILMVHINNLKTNNNIALTSLRKLLDQKSRQRKNNRKKKPPQLRWLALRTGIEPVLPEWKSGVLTPRRTERAKSWGKCSSSFKKYQFLIRENDKKRRLILKPPFLILINRLLHLICFQNYSVSAGDSFLTVTLISSPSPG